MANPSAMRRPRPARAGLRWLAPLTAGFALGAALAWAVGPATAAGTAVAEQARVRVAPPPIRPELARKWRQVLPPPITFDHMFRKDPDAVWR